MLQWRRIPKAFLGFINLILIVFMFVLFESMEVECCGSLLTPLCFQMQFFTEFVTGCFSSNYLYRLSASDGLREALL
jgi:hypothetical protein